MKNARQYAYEILQRVILEGGYASLLLRAGRNRFTREDTALISEIVYGTIRRYTLLQYQLKGTVKRKPSPKTEVLLCMGMYQLFFLDRIPVYAVIDETVELAGRHEKGFVNAVLRRVSERGLQYCQDEDPDQALAVNTGIPLWLIRMWNSHYGKETAERICTNSLEPAAVYGRINPLKISAQKLQEDPKVRMLDAYSFTYDGLLQETDYFRNGEILIQDKASAGIPQYLDVQPGMSVYDACSAPGTKAQMIAALMQNTGEVIANDDDPDRVRLIDELMQRTGTVNVRTTVSDASVFVPAYEGYFDRILLDVPCSGLGDLRHKPEIRYHVQPESLDQITALQKRILENTCRYLKKDGILVYSTCTLNRKENENQIRDFLKGHPEFTLTEERTIFPFEEGTDGFYCARLIKTGNSMVE